MKTFAMYQTKGNVEMFYLNTIKQLFLLVKQFEQLEVCLSYSRFGIPKGKSSWGENSIFNEIVKYGSN